MRGEGGLGILVGAGSMAVFALLAILVGTVDGPVVWAGRCIFSRSADRTVPDRDSPAPLF